MSALSQVVDSLEHQVERLLENQQSLKEQRSALEGEIEALKEEVGAARKTIERLQADYDSLKIARTMLGSNQYTRETKLKINALVRELDHCIAQLSD